MDGETAGVETCLLGGLWVPKSLLDLIESWSKRTREDAADVLRSILNLGLAHYVEMYPQSVPHMAKAMGDLDAMAPQGAKRYRLDAVEHSDGRLTLRHADEGEPDAVRIEVAAQPKMATLLKAHAARGDESVGAMLLELWCTDMLEHYCKAGNQTMVVALLDAWQEQGVPHYVQEHIDAIRQTVGRADQIPVK